jgi:acetyl-CoA decarbonylase/synthase complex subunit alpha
LLKSDNYPLNASIEKAFEDSQIIVLEADPRKMSDPKTQQLILTKGMLAQGDSLEDQLSKETYDLAKQKTSELGMDISAFNQLKPWMFSMTITIIELQKLGFNPQHGLDMYFFSKGLKDGKQIMGLETIEYQLDLFDSLSTAEQDALVRQTLKDLDIIQEKTDSLVEAWSIGDIKRVEAICTKCSECRRSCPNDMLIPEAIDAAAGGDLSLLNDLYDVCVGCGRCEEACPNDLDVHSFIVKAAEQKIKNEIFKTRSGRGAIQDVEIRKVGGPIVLGEIPGVIAHVGCANYPKGGEEVAEMIEEFAKRRYIILTSGCAAMSAGMHKNEDGKTVYESFPGDFDAGCVLNVGSCVANSHIAGVAIKIASIFAKRNLNANYEEIADYILNRVGAVGISWGAMSQKAASIASGFWRLGIPVIVGPHGSKYRRMLLGRKDRDSDWEVYDARTGERDYVGPSPEHLFYAAETKEEAMVMMAKLCMRPNDTTRGRAIKLNHYIDLHKRYYGRMPDDIHLYVRRLSDVPITMKDEIVRILDQKEWKEKNIPDPTILPRMIRKKEK